MRAVPQIVAMGGGGFLMEPRNPRLDDYVLGLTGKRRPRVCFLATASGDSATSIAKFHRAFPRQRAVASHLLLFNRDRRPLDEVLLNQDVIYVGGGNTANLLLIWRLHGIDRALRRAWRRGIVLAGVSAGMNCWFEACCTDSFGPLAPLEDGLGFLPGSACPHYDGEAERRPKYHQMMRRGLPAGHAADDGAALHFRGRRLFACVSSRPRARCYFVRRESSGVIETPLETRFLGCG
jgi:dipeptidase E